MVTEQTLGTAREVAAELRRQGRDEPARAVEALVAAAQDEALPSLDLLTTTEAGQLFGVSAQTIKNWVRDRRITGYRVGGRIMLPRAAVLEYVRQAGASLDLEELSDEAAAALVAESRHDARRARQPR
jgi:excisionase family DNA binding protein